MGRAQAEDVERFLQEHPDDLDAHKRLLIFYTANGTRFYDPPVVVAARRKHILWLIAHHPEDPFLATSDGMLSPSGPEQIADPSGSDAARKMWSALKARSDASPAVLANAAAEPRLPPEDGSSASLALKAQSSFDQGDLDAARKAAQDALSKGPDFQADMVLGLIAMQSGDRKSAVKYMMDAANVTSTADLAWFPDSVRYKLPAWLLREGERDSVIQFLERFSKTYAAGETELRASADLIRKGQKPSWY